MPGAAGNSPERVEVAVVDPDLMVSVLHHDIRGAVQATEVGDRNRIACHPVVVAFTGAGSGDLFRGLGHRHAGLYVPGFAVEDEKFEFPHTDHFVLAITVDIVDLEGQVRGKVRVGTFPGFAYLPEDIASQVHRCQAGDGVGVPSWAKPLGHDKVQASVPGQITPADLAAGAEVGQVDLLPDFGLGVPFPCRVQLTLQTVTGQHKGRMRGTGLLDFHMMEERRISGHQRDSPLVETFISYYRQVHVVDCRLECPSRHLHAQSNRLIT